MNRYAEVERAFLATRFVCADCGHELEDGELEEQAGEPLEMLRCFDCGAYSVHEVEVDIRHDLLRAAQNAAQFAAVIVERRPEMRERVERELTEARAAVGRFEREVAARMGGRG